MINKIIRTVSKIKTLVNFVKQGKSHTDDGFDRLDLIYKLAESIDADIIDYSTNPVSMFSFFDIEQAYKDGVRDALAKGHGTFNKENYTDGLGMY